MKKPSRLICKTCRTKFTDYPLRAHTTTRAFCSENCLPEDILDEYGAWDYVNSVYAYRDYLLRFKKVRTQIAKRDLLNDLELTMDQMGEYILCDAETVYVAYIQELFQYVDELAVALEKNLH